MDLAAISLNWRYRLAPGKFFYRVGRDVPRSIAGSGWLADFTVHWWLIDLCPLWDTCVKGTPPFPAR